MIKIAVDLVVWKGAFINIIFSFNVNYIRLYVQALCYVIEESSFYKKNPL